MINDLLQKFLKRKGVNEFSELTEEEKQTYREWDEILVGKKLTDADVATFLDKELSDVLQKLTDPKLPQREDVFLKMKLEFITKIKAFLATPELAKELLKANLENL